MMASLRKVHANLLCIVSVAHSPLEVEDEFRESRKSTAMMQRARGDEEDVARSSATRIEGELVVNRPL